MAEAQVLQEFLAVMGYRVDESSERRFVDAITSMTKLVEGLGLGIAAAAAGVVTGVAQMAASAEQMHYLSQRVNETVTNIDALAFSLSKMGASPAETIKTIQSIGDALRNNLAFKSIWEAELGTGPMNQQLANLGEKLKSAGPAIKNYWHELFKDAHISEDVWLAIQRPGLAEGVGEFKSVMQRLGYDPDKFADQSVKFENALRDLELRITGVWGHVSQSLIGPITDGITGITSFIDAHSGEIKEAIDKIYKFLVKFGNDVIDVIKDLTGWFNNLSPASKEAAEAIGLIAAAFLLPGFSMIAVIGAAIVALIEDYEKFKQTGKSDYGIPWRELAVAVKDVLELLSGPSGITERLKFMVEFMATYWLPGMTESLKFMVEFMATYWLPGMLGPLGRVYIVAKAIKDLLDWGGGAVSKWIFGEEKADRMAAVRKLGPAPTEEQIDWARKGGKGPMPAGPSTLEQLGTAGSQALTGANDAIHWGEKAFQPFKDWLLKLKLSDLNPIGAAHAEVLPQKIGELNDTLSNLNDLITQHFAEGLTKSFGVGSGGGPGPGSGGAGKVNWNDPKMIQGIKYFMANGYSMPQAMGIMANFYAESNLDEHIVNASGHAGIAQWDKARQANFRLMEGVDIMHSTYEQQLDFARRELETTHKKAGDALKKAADVVSSVGIVNRGFEVSGDESGRREGIGSTLSGKLGPLLANPNDAIYNSSADKNVNLNQTNSVVIHGSNDPAETGRAIDQVQQKNWGDMTRHLQTNMQ